ncbi:MAG: hypothetical protein V3S24_21665 [Candidatus Tectomicrobia bacterium]
MFSSNLAGQGIEDKRVEALQEKLSRLQRLENFSNADQFWSAWNELQALKTTLQQLDPSTPQQRFLGKGVYAQLRSILPFGLAGSVLANTFLIAFLSSLMYVLDRSLSGYQLLLFFGSGAFGGFLVGGAIGWLWSWYRPQV